MPNISKIQRVKAPICTQLINKNFYFFNPSLQIGFTKNAKESINFFFNV
ncbi:hypothetical protein FDUTEX481_01143 [Tolypothrix sp. PCC 7601]|nr:hypothetical protein FDUTEX481_01143 [Tolypothrix sp. PCC 7601]